MLCTSENLDNQDFEFLNILQNLHKSSDYIETSAERAEKKTNDSVKKKNLSLQMNLDFLDVTVQKPSSN